MYRIEVWDRARSAKLSERIFWTLSEALYGRVEMLSQWRGVGLVTSPIRTVVHD